MKKVFNLLLCSIMCFCLIGANTQVTKAVNIPLTFTAQEAGSTISLSWYSGSNVMYKASSTNVKLGEIGSQTNASTDWSTYSPNTKITLPLGEKVSFKGSEVITSNYEHFTMTGKIAASGDVTSLTNETGGSATLSDNCYLEMFSGCSALTTIPSLPATTLTESCYNSMFKNCTGLTSIPANLLQGNTLIKSCYSGMFFGCTGLTSIPSNLLPSTSLANDCYNTMFKNCTGLTSIPSNLLPSTSLAMSCYSEMFSGCTALTNIPSLPATALENGCYGLMFNNCSNIKISEEKVGNYTVPFTLPNEGSAEYPYVNMFSGTGGTFTGTPVSGTYYLAADPKPVTTVDNSTPTTCEYVIGPRWHWNDAKGVCELEGYSVINTSTK